MTDHVDVLIVGAGPSGAVCAHSLATRGLSVLCLEQGGWVRTPSTPGGQSELELLSRRSWNWDGNRRALWADVPVNGSDADLPALMYPAVGGSSIIYGGHWHRLHPNDFQVATRDGVAADWPITYDDLAPYYQQVEDFIGVAGLDGDPAVAPQGYPLPPHPIGSAGTMMATAMNSLGWHWWPGPVAIPSSPFKHMGQCKRWGICERGCPVGAKASFDLAYWPHALAAGASLKTSARVARITTTRNGLADGAIWLDRAGVEHRVRANSVVVAANGVGTPRLLLMSNDRQPDGLANSSGLVGKNLMMHPISSCVGAYDADIETWNGPAGQLMYSMEFYGTDTSRDFVRGAKWSLVPLPGILATLDHFRELPFHERWGAGVHALSRYSGSMLGWYATVDDLPDESNRVELDPNLSDSSGLPAPRVRYRISNDSSRNMDFAVERMREAHGAAGAVHTVSETSMPSGHLMGTARMGDDPTKAVVDCYGRAHDIPNLFVVDGSVMVTGGAVNPTATITALAARTAEHLADLASGMPTLN
jgi:choline dehydrogenase-like flavoprotein